MQNEQYFLANNTTERRADYPDGCNWWCRRKMDVRQIWGSFRDGGIAGAIEEAIEIMSNSDINIFTNRLGDSYFENIIFTTLEESYLDSWFLYFEPFYTTSLQASENLILSNFSDKNALDGLLQKLYSVKTYYKSLSVNNSGLSADVFEARKQLVIDSMDEVINAVMLKATSLGLQSVDYEYEGVLIKGVTTGQYTAIGKSFTKQSNVLIVTDEIDQDVVSIDDEIDYTDPIEDNSEVITNTETEPKKYSTLKKIGTGILIGVGISKLIK